MQGKYNQNMQYLWMKTLKMKNPVAGVNYLSTGPWVKRPLMYLKRYRSLSLILAAYLSYMVRPYDWTQYILWLKDKVKSSCN